MTSSPLRLLVLALCAAAGSDSLLESAQSLPVSTYCVTAGQCAALCRHFVEGDSGPEEFIRRAAYELGPPDSFTLPPSDGAPPVVDPSNILFGDPRQQFQSGGGRRPAAHLFAEPHHRQGRRHRPRTFAVVDHFRRRRQPAAHRAVLGPADAVGDRRRQRAGGAWLAGADRSEDRQARRSGRSPRRLQHVLHAGRALGDRRRRGDAPAGVPRSPYDGAAGLHQRPAMLGRQPRRFCGRRLLRDLHLRI